MSSEPNNDPRTPLRRGERGRQSQGDGSSANRAGDIPGYGHSHVNMRFGMKRPDPKVHEDRQKKIAKDMNFYNSVEESPKEYFGPGNYGALISEYDPFVRETILNTKDILDLQELCFKKGNNFSEAHGLIMDEAMDKRKSRFHAIMSEIGASKSALELKREIKLEKDALRFQKLLVSMAGFDWSWEPKEEVTLEMVNEVLFDWRKRIGNYKIWKNEPVNVHQGEAYLMICPPDVDEEHEDFHQFMTTQTRLQAYDHMQEIVKIRPTRSQWILMDSLVKALGDLIPHADVVLMYQKAYKTKGDCSSVIGELMTICKKNGVRIPNKKEAEAEHEKNQKKKKTTRANASRAAGTRVAESLAE